MFDNVTLEAFLSWLLGELDDQDTLVKLARAAMRDYAALPVRVDHGFALERALEVFIQYLADDAVCDHSVGICACKLREALRLDLWRDVDEAE